MNRFNLIWNFVGLLIPLCVAVVAIPVLLVQVGAERFGFLGLAWGLIGYASLMDLGMGRAVTQKVAVIRGTTDEGDVRTIIVSAVCVTGLLSVVIGGMIFAVSLTSLVDYIPRDLVTQSEIRISLQLMALTLPLQALSAIYRGVNQAYLNFQGISVVRIFLGVANFGGPCLISLFATELHYLVASLFVSRVIAIIAFYWLAQKIVKKAVHGHRARFSFAKMTSLLQFGGWVAVSGVVSPFLGQADRYFIAIMVSVTAVSSYVVPYEITVQLLILTGAITTVAFPAIAQKLTQDPGAAPALFLVWTKRTAILMLTVTVTMAAGMPYLLDVWVGDAVSPVSATVGQILCIGVFFNAVGGMYYSYLHAQGQAKITAIFHLVQLPIFMGLLWVLISVFGLPGAAIAWSARVGLDMALLMLAFRSLLKKGIAPAECKITT